MKKIALSISIIALLVGFGFAKGRAQSIHFNMDVYPELHAEIVRDLSFGTLIANSGTHHISESSPKAGIFRIRGLRDHRIIVSLDMPNYLTHQSNTIADRIPIDLRASYSPSNTQSAHSLQALRELPKTLTLTDSNAQSNSSVWQSRYIYIYGSATVKNVKAGRYTQPLTLTVEYH